MNARICVFASLALMIGMTAPAVAGESSPPANVPTTLRISHVLPASTAPTTQPAEATQGQTDGGGSRLRISVIPYLWAAGIKGNGTVGGLTAPVDASFTDLAEYLKFGAMLRLELWKDSWGFIFDGMYMNLGGEATREFFRFDLAEQLGIFDRLDGRRLSELRLRLDDRFHRLRIVLGSPAGRRILRFMLDRLGVTERIEAIRDMAVAARVALAAATPSRTFSLKVEESVGIFDLAAAHRFDEFPLGGSGAAIWFDVFGGGRVICLKQQFRLSMVGPRRAESLTLGGSESWVEPFIGGRFNLRICRPVRFFIQADYGGWSLPNVSEYTWNLAAGFDFQVHTNVSIGVGWRMMGMNYDNGDTGPGRVGLDVQMQGLYLTFGFHF
jgi:hypothetical protein